jgi:hypothetical protein
MRHGTATLPFRSVSKNLNRRKQPADRTNYPSRISSCSNDGEEFRHDGVNGRREPAQEDGHIEENRQKDVKGRACETQLGASRTEAFSDSGATCDEALRRHV